MPRKSSPQSLRAKVYAAHAEIADALAAGYTISQVAEALGCADRLHSVRTYYYQARQRAQLAAEARNAARRPAISGEEATM